MSVKSMLGSVAGVLSCLRNSMIQSTIADESWLGRSGKRASRLSFSSIAGALNLTTFDISTALSSL